MAIIYRGRVSGNYQYWNEDQTPPVGATNITIVNVPALTASHVDRSVYAPDGISGSLTQLTGSTSYLVAGANITISSASNGPITISSTGGGSGDTYWQSDVNNVIYTTGSVEITGSVELGVAGAGRGLLRVGTLDISPITGSTTVNGSSAPYTAILNGNILSASAGTYGVVRHEFHILGEGYAGLNHNVFAATYLGMSVVDPISSIQTIRAITELTREASGSHAETWDVNINENGDIAVTGSNTGGTIYWYGQRVKEMGLYQLIRT
jgi:hypothetical protein